MFRRSPALATWYAGAMNTEDSDLRMKPAPAATSRRRHLRRRGASAAAAALATLATLWSSAALAEQFVVLDSTWDHTPDLPDSHYRVEPLPGTPADWKSPIDYASGTAHIHLEVFTKPTDTPTKFQVCFEATPTYACTDQSPTYTEAGVIDWSTPFSNFWSPPNTMVDWSKGTVKIAVILKDTMNGKPSADNVGEDTAKLYMPTKVRMVVTIVAPGSEYIPPTSGEADAGAPPDAGPGEPDAGAPIGSDAGGQGGGDGSGGSPAGPQPGAPGSDSGCSVASGTSGGRGWGSAASAAWLVIAASALARRYRTRARFGSPR